MGLKEAQGKFIRYVVPATVIWVKMVCAEAAESTAARESVLEYFITLVLQVGL
jgi:hypothetical protein